MAIHYYTEDCNYKLAQKRLLSRWLKASAKTQGYDVGEINVILCSAAYLLEMNKQYLQHDYFTDIITFDYSDLVEQKQVSGDLFIDIETVADNAPQYDTTPLRELHRVIVHGVLHLCGQHDKSPEDFDEMKRKEAVCLELLDQLQIEN